MSVTFASRLLIAPVNQNGEINAEANENRAKTYCHHVEAVKNQEARGQPNQATKQQREAHTKQRQPPPKADEKDGTDQRDRTQHGGNNVVAHAERNFRDIGGTPSDEHFEFAAIPAFQRRCAKCIHLLHQFLTIKGADTWLVRHRWENAHGEIGRSQWLICFHRGVAGKRFERWSDKTEWIERQFYFRAGRTAFDLPAQLRETFLNFLRLKQRNRAIKILRLEIEQKRECNPL